MKKLILVVATTLMSLTAFAQAGKIAAGVYGSYVSKDPGLVGIGAKVQYNILDNVRPEASFTYFFEKDNYKSWEANVNVHYLFNLGAVNVYPLAGINYTHGKIDFPSIDLGDYGSYGGGSESEGKIGANLGAGIEFPFTDSITLGAEAKYTINKLYDNGSLVVGLGVTFKF